MEDARGDPGALAEAQQRDPVARCASSVVGVHCRRERRSDLIYRVLGAAFRVVGRRRLPGFEGAVLLIHRGYVGARLRREGRLSIDEAEGGKKGALEDAALHAENAGIGPAAVEAEKAREVKGWLLDLVGLDDHGKW